MKCGLLGILKWIAVVFVVVFFGVFIVAFIVDKFSLKDVVGDDVAAHLPSGEPMPSIPGNVPGMIPGTGSGNQWFPGTVGDLTVNGTLRVLSSAVAGTSAQIVFDSTGVYHEAMGVPRKKLLAQGDPLPASQAKPRAYVVYAPSVPATVVAGPVFVALFQSVSAAPTVAERGTAGLPQGTLGHVSFYASAAYNGTLLCELSGAPLIETGPGRAEFAGAQPISLHTIVPVPLIPSTATVRCTGTGPVAISRMHWAWNEM